MSIQRGGRLDRRSGFQELPRRRRRASSRDTVIVALVGLAFVATALPLFLAALRTGWLP